MEDWPDDHLDDLFRKSAEEYEVPFNPDDWTDMSRRLDKYDRQMLFDRISRWGGIGALLLLLLGGVGWVMYDRNPAGNPQKQLVVEVLAPGTASATSPARISEVSKTDSPPKGVERPAPALNAVPERQPANTLDELPEQVSMPIKNSPAGQRTTKNGASQPVVRVDQQADRLVDGLTASVPGRPATGEKPGVGTIGEPMFRQTSRRVARSSLKKRNQPVTDDLTLATRPIAEKATRNSAPTGPDQPTGTYPATTNNLPERIARNQPDLAARYTEQGQTIVAESRADSKWLPALSPLTSLSTVSQQVRPVTEPTPSEMAVSAPARRATPRLSKLSVMLFASPDLSGIGLTNFDRPGSNAGLAVQYQVTDRLSVNAGVMYSTKRYQAYTENYVWPAYMTMEVWPQEISGVCKMIDVPLNVRYDWLVRPRGDDRAPARWFTSAGLTSYFIRHEVYTYDYDNPYDPKIKYRGWDNQKAGRPGGSFGFSNLNISMGYERPITNRLSWQVEPFMKVPLKQVGYFNIKLLSTGAFVGLRYRL